MKLVPARPSSAVRAHAALRVRLTHPRRLGWWIAMGAAALLWAHAGAAAAPAASSQKPTGLTAQEKREQALREKEARGRYDLIRREREAALIRYNYMLPGLRTERKRKAAYEKHFPKPILWAPRFFEVHEQYPGTEAAGLALIWIVTHLDSTPLEVEARRVLLNQHIHLSELTAVCSALGSAPRAGGEADLIWLFEKSPIPEVQAGALIQLCKLDLESWQAQQSATVQERLQHRLAMLEVRFSNLRFEGRTGRDWAKQLFREMAHLTLGQQFLNWQAKTLAGEARQLSALRGKVVVLFFWKSNSNQSRKVVPQVKAFCNAWKEAPVACIGVSGDANAERAERWATILDLPFEQWHAPPTSQEPHPFGVETWPGFFVLNAEGRILASRADWPTAKKAADMEIQRLIQAEREAEAERRAREEGPEREPETDEPQPGDLGPGDLSPDGPKADRLNAKPPKAGGPPAAVRDDAPWNPSPVRAGAQDFRPDGPPVPQPKSHAR